MAYKTLMCSILMCHGCSCVHTFQGQVFAFGRTDLGPLGRDPTNRMHNPQGPAARRAHVGGGRRCVAALLSTHIEKNLAACMRSPVILVCVCVLVCVYMCVLERVSILTKLQVIRSWFLRDLLTRGYRYRRVPKF